MKDCSILISGYGWDYSPVLWPRAMGNTILYRCKECLSSLDEDIARLAGAGQVWCYECENYISEVI